MQNLSHTLAHHKSLRISPRLAPCPSCGQLVKRHETKTRYFWQANLCEPTIINLQFGYYICPLCPKGEKAFSLIPPIFRTPCQYDRLTQALVIDLMSITTNRAAIELIRDWFHLPDLHETTIQRWYVKKSEELRENELHRRKLLNDFSRQLAIDEMYDNGWCIIRVTDPHQNAEIAFKLLDRDPTKDDIEAILRDLKEEGFEPLIVNTDGSPLYPGLIEKVWSQARHQRCVFHFIKQMLKLLFPAFWEAYQTMPLPKKGPKGRPSNKDKERAGREKEKKKNCEIVRKSRWLNFKNPENLSEKENERLSDTLELCPALRPLRELICAILALFGSSATLQEAEEKRLAICSSVLFQSKESFSKVLKNLEDKELFEKLTAYLHFENAVKTTNHVEGENRSYRQRQKVRYRFRCESSIQALLIHLHYRKQPSSVSSHTPIRVRLRKPGSSPGESPPSLSLCEEEVKQAA